MATDPVDGSYYIIGDDYGDTLYVAKFTAEGLPDTTFGGDGHIQLPRRPMETRWTALSTLFIALLSLETFVPRLE